MSGKCRPSLRKKAIMVVMQSDFSKAVKECIAEVFEGKGFLCNAYYSVSMYDLDQIAKEMVGDTDV